MTKFHKYWLFSLAGTLVLSYYPLKMGFSVIYDMVTKGTVLQENYPKYIIPYTPIALSLIVSVLFMPLIFKFAKRFTQLFASALSLSVFFVSEFLLESKVIVTSTVVTTLESWQMYMCYVVPSEFETRTWRPVDVLIGEYSESFKFHFYLISIVLIIAILNSVFGFAHTVRTNDKKRIKALTVESVCAALFLGLCILACFTAFFRNGDIYVSPLSAMLMSLFFTILGVTVGVYTGSFLIGKKRVISLVLPSVAAALTTLAMYIGEMFLLSGHLYRFGRGFVFAAMGPIVLAPVDILIIFLSGIISFGICSVLNSKERSALCCEIVNS